MGFLPVEAWTQSRRLVVVTHLQLYLQRNENDEDKLLNSIVRYHKRGALLYSRIKTSEHVMAKVKLTFVTESQNQNFTLENLWGFSHGNFLFRSVRNTAPRYSHKTQNCDCRVICDDCKRESLVPRKRLPSLSFVFSRAMLSLTFRFKKKRHL